MKTDQLLIVRFLRANHIHVVRNTIFPTDATKIEKVRSFLTVANVEFEEEIGSIKYTPGSDILKQVRNEISKAVKEKVNANTTLDRSHGDGYINIRFTHLVNNWAEGLTEGEIKTIVIPIMETAREIFTKYSGYKLSHTQELVFDMRNRTSSINIIPQTRRI
jgi:hypothetical protein